jgi:sulfur-oxidizing protein SoxX
MTGAGWRLVLGAALAFRGAAFIGTLPAAAAEPAARTMDTPLTSLPGDPARGRQVARDLGKAACLICHAMPIPEEPDHGTIGPPLAGVGKRYTAGELRMRLVDSTVANPDTVMPSYYRTDGLYRVLGTFRGQTIYSAQEVEDVVAYLMTLTAE